MPLYEPTGISIEINRKRRAARARTPMAHIENGWPHYRHNTGRCICLDPCCHNEEKGCICKTCECRINAEAHNVTTA